MTVIQICLLATMVMNVAALTIMWIKQLPPSRWTDVSAALAVLATILYAAGVR